MTSSGQIHHTGPFAVITVVFFSQSLPTPNRSSCQPDFAYNFESLWIYFIGNWPKSVRKIKFRTETVEFGHSGHASCCQSQFHPKLDLGRRDEDFQGLGEGVKQNSESLKESPSQEPGPSIPREYLIHFLPRHLKSIVFSPKEKTPVAPCKMSSECCQGRQKIEQIKWKLWALSCALHMSQGFPRMSWHMKTTLTQPSGCRSAGPSDNGILGLSTQIFLIHRMPTFPQRVVRVVMSAIWDRYI